MSRPGNDAGRRQADEDLDQLARKRPNEPPVPFDPDPEAWESQCAGNRTLHHMAPSAKLADQWRCGSCSRWLRPPRTRRTP
jgi:hypothetical protein